MSETPLLNILAEQNRDKPLAERLRPKTLDDFLGQSQIVGDETPLRNLLESRQLTSMIFWGPPGCGKTTLARMIAQYSSARFIELSAVTSGIKDLREVIEGANDALKTSGQKTVLFIDEIHRYSKTQQDALLPHVENGTITLMGATTENPSFQVISALQSRVLVFQFTPLSREHIKTLVLKGLKVLGNVAFNEEAVGFIVDYANGDGRSALNILEVAYKCAPYDNNEDPSKQRKVLTLEVLEMLAQQNRLNYDRQGDEHYDHASAYQKSMRGGDADAAVYWMAKMIAAGEDPRFIARRLVVTAAEDIGLADPMALIVAQEAAKSVQDIGLPECRIMLSMATIYVAQAPKSNTAINAVDKAIRDITKEGKSYPVPKHLRDSHYAGAEQYGHGTDYIYTHSNPDAEQTFLPEELVGTKYVDTSSP